MWRMSSATTLSHGLRSEWENLSGLLLLFTP